MVAPGRRDDRHPAGDQVGCQRPQPIRLILRIAVFDGNILARHISGFAQAAAKAFHEVTALAGRNTVQEPARRHRRLLPPRAAYLEREQQSAATEQCDELTPLHVRHGDFLPYALLARRPTRALGFPAPQPVTERPASPWGKPELF